MNRRPRSPGASLFSPVLIGWSLLQGASVLLGTGIIYVLAHLRGLPEAEVRSLSFLTLVIGDIALILLGRSFNTSVARALLRPNPILWAVLGADMLLMGLVLNWPPLKGLFQFGPIHTDDIALAAATGVAILVTLELLKKPFRQALHS